MAYHRVHEREHAHRPHLQHLRRADAAERRPRAAELHVPGARGEPITVYGDGKQTRSFRYVSDLVEGIFRLLYTDYHEPVNIGNPAEITILEFAEEMQKLAGAQERDRLPAAAAGRPEGAPAGHHAARGKLLGWEPKVGRDEGLKRTMDFFRRKLGR